MKYAIIRLKGHQYKISEGDEFLVDRAADGLSPEVLLTVADETVVVGKPVIADTKIKLESIGEEKGDKIDVFKYKSKSRSRRKVGFRSQKTRVRVDKLGF